MSIKAKHTLKTPRPSPYENKDLEDVYVFKVGDYSTHMVGRFVRETNSFYVERGDGTKWEYEMGRVEWFTPLIIDPFYQRKEK